MPEPRPRPNPAVLSLALVLCSPASAQVTQRVSIAPNGAEANGTSFNFSGAISADGQLERLFVKAASGGSITAPELGAGDPTVSARSALLGDPIAPGGTRLYFVYYRDPLVLGGCPGSATFNATQAGRVAWWP